MSAYYARLQPFDPRREHAMRLFVLGNLRFDAGTWMAVDKPTAEVLRRVHQSYYDALSPLAFEVRSQQEHEAQQAGEAVAEPSRMAAAEAVVAASGDGDEVSMPALKLGGRNPRKGRES